MRANVFAITATAAWNEAEGRGERSGQGQWRPLRLRSTVSHFGQRQTNSPGLQARRAQQGGMAGSGVSPGTGQEGMAGL